MDMGLMKYMVDKTKGHKLSMDIIMGLSVVMHYEASGGLLICEFSKLIGENYKQVMESLEKQNVIIVKDGNIFVGNGLPELKNRASKYFNENYGDIITVF